MPLDSFVPYTLPPSLQVFSCISCQLVGDIPATFFADSDMTSLTTIRLAHNDLSGSITHEMAHLPSLVHLDVYANPSLDVVLPSGLCKEWRREPMSFLRTDWCQDLPEDCSTVTNIVACCSQQTRRKLCTEYTSAPIEILHFGGRKLRRSSVAAKRAI